MAMTAHKDFDNNAVVYGKLISQERTRLGVTTRRLADSCGTSQATVKAWEAGEAFPSPQERKRMEAFLKGMKRYWNLVPVRGQAGENVTEPELVPSATTILEQGKKEGRTRTFHKKPLPRPIESYPTFGAALRAVRKAEGLTCDELGRLMGLGGGTSHWEVGRTVPVQGNYEKLLTLLPILAHGPKPESVKTRGVPGRRWAEPLKQGLGPVLQKALAPQEDADEEACADAMLEGMDTAAMSARLDRDARVRQVAEAPTPVRLVTADKPPVQAPENTDPQVVALAAQEFTQAQGEVDQYTKDANDAELRMETAKRGLEKSRANLATAIEKRDKALHEMRRLIGS